MSRNIIESKKFEPAELYFELQASWGLTKHMGGLKATREILELCHVNKDSYVLDVGCGVGATACYIAKEYGCKVVGVDLSEGMIDRSRERAKRKGVEDRVKFMVADAQNLPFKDDLFDTVISESVTVFLEDKQKAVSEYARVTKPGGYVGLNEVTWINPPPAEVADYLSHALGGAEFLTSDVWKKLLEGSGLTNIGVKTYETNALSQWANEMKSLDFRDFAKAWYKFFSLCIKSRAVRKYVRELWPPPKSIFRIFKYFGYGLYVGRK
jgi:ubiquinone/menaquinone biosynthesis C-methylase UbiE